jgi:hypothetical protein
MKPSPTIAKVLERLSMTRDGKLDPRLREAGGVDTRFSESGG